MSKRIVISIIKVDHEEYNYKGDLTFRKQFVTDMPIDRIRGLLDFGEGFSLNIVDGRNIMFVDFHNFGVHSDKKIIKAINKIPKVSTIPTVDNTGRVIMKNIDAGDDETKPDKDKAFLTTFQKYEMGAGDLWTEILLILNDPYANFAISYIMGKGVDWFLGVLRRITPFSLRNNYNEPKVVFANIRKIYKNAATAINSKIEFLQIVKMETVENGKIKVLIRTYDDEIYLFICKPSGKIIEFKMLHGRLWEIFCGEKETAACGEQETGELTS